MFISGGRGLGRLPTSACVSPARAESLNAGVVTGRRVTADTTGPRPAGAEERANPEEAAASALAQGGLRVAFEAALSVAAAASPRPPWVKGSSRSGHGAATLRRRAGPAPNALHSAPVSLTVTCTCSGPPTPLHYLSRPRSGPWSSGGCRTSPLVPLRAGEAGDRRVLGTAEFWPERGAPAGRTRRRW